MRIHELPGEVVMKIAAGEVVTGSFSIVKELVENSVDAGASSIEVEVKGGGREYIRVRDDGYGMDPDELRLSIKPHTTSKLLKIEDLDSLETFGFRGEALSTIAGVSRMKLSSVVAGEETGLTLEIAGGQILGERPFGGKPGTTVEVYDLLFNTPARRKFLKTPVSEGKQVTETVQHFMLAFPKIGLKFVRDGQVIYDGKPGQSLEERVLLMNSGLQADDLITVDEIFQGVRIRGFITLPIRTKGNRTGENMFVNSRFVKQNELNYALERGYGESLEKGRYPFAVLFIETDPSEIDVNIHPQKLEVKFSSNATVFESIKRAVRSAVRSRGSFVINIDHETGQHAQPVYRPPEMDKSVPLDGNRVYDRAYEETRNPGRSAGVQQPMNIELDRTISRRFDNQTEPEEVTDDRTTFIGVFGERYILIESIRGLEIIDQHAAHERIIYEDLKTGGKEISSQNLLLPLRITLSADNMDLFIARQAEIEKLGFKGGVMDGKISLAAIPSIIGESEAETVLEEILDELKLEGLEEPGKVFDHILASIACKAAVRTGDRLDEFQARELVRELKARKLLVCPHGRPISMVLSYRDLDRYFSR